MTDSSRFLFAPGSTLTLTALPVEGGTSALFSWTTSTALGRGLNTSSTVRLLPGVANDGDSDETKRTNGESSEVAHAGSLVGSEHVEDSALLSGAGLLSHVPLSGDSSTEFPDPAAPASSASSSATVELTMKQSSVRS